MRTETLIAAIAMSVVVLGQSPKPVRNPIPSGRGEIAGRVVDALSRQPVSGATIRLQPLGKYSEWAPGLDQDPSRRTTTGATGEFRFTDLGPIDYDVSAWASGYSEGGVGQTWSLGTRAPIRLEQDQRMTALEIRLWPTADLTGRVLDERGQPLAGAVVIALRETFAEGRRQFSFYMSQATTDSRGEYRMTLQLPTRVKLCVRPTYSSFPIPGLSPAQRRLVEPPAGSAQIPQMLVTSDARHLVEFDLVPPPAAPDGSPRAYVPTCAPSATSSDDAAIIDVRPGGVVAPDLTMQWQQAARVTGRLLGPDGPLGQAWLRLWPADGDHARGFATAQALTAPDGSFAFLIVPPGSYTWDVTVTTPPPTVTPSASGFPTVNRPHGGSVDPRGYWIGEQMDVGTRNIDDLILTARHGVTVSGKVIVDGPGPSTPQVSLNLRKGPEGFGRLYVRTAADGRFHIPGVIPGRYGVSASAHGWTVAEVTAGGNDVLDLPFVVGDENVDDLVLRFSSAPSGLAGIVRETTGALIQQATVVVYPTDARTWKPILEEPLRIRSTRAVAGRYVFDHLPPGDYHVAAIDDALMARWMDPSLFATLATTAHRVAVQLGEQRILDVVKR